MTVIQPQFHSHHLEELKKEVRKKFENELNDPSDSFIKRKVQEVIGCLEKAVVPVDILRSIDFNLALDKKKNFYFYGLRIHLINTNAHVVAKLKNIRRTLQISVQMMNPKDLWKILLTTVLTELQESDNFESLMRIGSDFKFSKRLEGIVDCEPDFIIVGPRPEIDFPLLLVDISTKFNPAKMQSMMMTVLIDSYNSRNHWPLRELKNLVVYGLIIVDYEFYICKMALRPEKNMKFAFVFIKGRRVLPRSLFVDPDAKKSSFHEEVVAEIQDSTNEEECESSEDESVGCVFNDFEELSINENEEVVTSAVKNKTTATSAPVKHDYHGARRYRRPHGGGVVAIVSLLQTVLAQHLIVKSKDASYKKFKPKN